MNGRITQLYITGVAGMIGSNIARDVTKLGVKVIGIDNFWRGTRDNLVDLLDQPNFEFRYADIISDQDWFRDMDERSVLIHTADIVAGIGYVFANEWQVFQKNLLINTQIARVVSIARPERLIYLGTACSYPQSLQRSVQSSILSEWQKFPADPESGYGWSKLIGEVEFLLATKHSPTRLLVLDLHNVYGWPCAYADDTAQVIPALIHKAATSTNRRLSVWGTGQQGRAFLHVLDVVSGIRAALGYDGSEKVIMLGPQNCTTIAEVARLISEHPRMKIDRIDFDTSKPTGDIGRYADASLALRELAWSPKVEFREGLYGVVDRILDDLNREQPAARK